MYLIFGVFSFIFLKVNCTFTYIANIILDPYNNILNSSIYCVYFHVHNCMLYEHKATSAHVNGYVRLFMTFMCFKIVIKPC